MDKVVVVTGAGGFIGSAIALAFGKAGDKVALFDLKPVGLAELAAVINQGSGQAFFGSGDVRRFEDVQRIVDETVEKWKRLDVMSCVAGGGYARLSGKEEKALFDCTDEDWDLVIDTNLKGVFHSVKAAVPVMMAQRSGHIIIMSSGTGLKGEAKRSIYAAAKSGVNGMMKSVARELGEYNVQVNAVNPGRTIRPGEADQVRQVEENVLKRTHKDASQTANFFLHLSDMRDVSGQIFNLDSRILF